MWGLLKKHWFWLSWAIIVLALAVLAVWLMRTWILPYSTRYHGATQLSTVPVGVADSANPVVDSGVSARPAKSVVLVPLTTTAPVAIDFAQPILFRIDVVDADGVVVDGAAETVTLSSSSATGQFSTGQAAELPKGAQTRVVKYRDTVATKATLSAFVSGLVGSSLSVLTTAGPAERLGEITPAVSKPRVGTELSYSVTVEDAFGNSVSQGEVAWRLTNQTGGASQPRTASTTIDALGRSNFPFTPAPSDVGTSFVLEARLGAVARQLTLTPTN